MTQEIASFTGPDDFEKLQLAVKERSWEAEHDPAGQKVSFTFPFAPTEKMMKMHSDNLAAQSLLFNCRSRIEDRPFVMEVDFDRPDGNLIGFFKLSTEWPIPDNMPEALDKASHILIDNLLASD